jgi:hypothetical protein
VEAEEELAKVAKELEEAMEAELDRAGDADATPRVRRDLFRDSEVEAEPDKTSEDLWEKEWVAAHKEMKSAEIHPATARDNLTTAVYAQGSTPGVEMDGQLVVWWKELWEAVAHVRSAWAKDTMLTLSVIA